MFEKVNPKHPDKIADRIAGALVDWAYTQEDNPKVAIEVLIGHNNCYITIESSVHFTTEVVNQIVYRISESRPYIYISFNEQDPILASNQNEVIRCGDNGIFKGMPVTVEQIELSNIARDLYDKYSSDGKYIYNQDDDTLIICQSNAETVDLKQMYPGATVNPLGNWTGGLGVDSGATNRKLGSDMADSVTGGGLHGKDLSKADVSVNVYAWLKAQATGEPVELYCAIGDQYIDGKPYAAIVDIAKDYISTIGGFEKFAEWGLV